MKSIIYAFVISCTLTGCGIIGPIEGHFPEHKEHKKESEKVHPLSSLRVPRGHLPPPGKCRIWIPGRPPGHQPRPESCASAMLNAPPGSWVITHTSGKYKVSVFNRSKKNVVDEVKWYSSK